MFAEELHSMVKVYRLMLFDFEESFKESRKVNLPRIATNIIIECFELNKLVPVTNQYYGVNNAPNHFKKCNCKFKSIICGE